MKSGTARIAVSRAICSASNCWMMFIDLCPLSLVLVARREPHGAAHRSGRRSRVMRSASARRHAATAA